MKKLLLMFSAGLVCAGAIAQTAHKATTKVPQAQAKKATGSVNPEAGVSTAASTTHAKANKTSSLHSRWYNHSIAAAFYNNSGSTQNGVLDSTSYYSDDHAVLAATWPDSTIHYSASESGISFLSFGQTFDPAVSVYNDQSFFPADVAANNIVGHNAPYSIDSVMVMGRYTRVDPANTLVDTLIFTFTYETDSFRFLYDGYNSVADHNISSFPLMVYDQTDYGNQLANGTQIPINQSPYSYTDNHGIGDTQIKLPLTEAMANDTFTDGALTGLSRFYVAPNINMVAGGVAAVSITYKPSSLITYDSASTIDQYNFFSLLSHEPVTDGFELYNVDDTTNMSSIVYKDTTFGNLNTLFNFYIPNLAWTAPYTLEDHDIAWKATFDPALGVHNTTPAFATFKAFPNPANNTLNIPVTMADAGTVTVTLSNTAGQVIATRNLGTIAAGATKAATFSTSTLANGTYFYTVSTGDRRVSKPVTIAH